MKPQQPREPSQLLTPVTPAGQLAAPAPCAHGSVYTSRAAVALPLTKAKLQHLRREALPAAWVMDPHQCGYKYSELGKAPQYRCLRQIWHILCEEGCAR